MTFCLFYVLAEKYVETYDVTNSTSLPDEMTTGVILIVINILKVVTVDIPEASQTLNENILLV